jgi:gliding motility-associated-like protein
VEGITPGAYGYKVSLTVYNRYGRIVYENEDYQYDWRGDDLPAGVYYYQVSIQNHASCKSWLQLVK